MMHDTRNHLSFERFKSSQSLMKETPKDGQRKLVKSLNMDLNFCFFPFILLSLSVSLQNKKRTISKKKEPLMTKKRKPREEEEKSDQYNLQLFCVVLSHANSIAFNSSSIVFNIFENAFSPHATRSIVSL